MSEVLREALQLALLVAAPAAIASLAVGLAMGVLQAATQVQEPTLSLVPRLVAVFAVLAAVGPWMGRELARFAADLFTRFPDLAR